MKILHVLKKLSDGHVVQVGNRKLRMIDGRIYTRNRLYRNGEATNKMITVEVHTSISSFINECETEPIEVSKRVVK